MHKNSKQIDAKYKATFWLMYIWDMGLCPLICQPVLAAPLTSVIFCGNPFWYWGQTNLEHSINIMAVDALVMGVTGISKAMLLIM